MSQVPLQSLTRRYVVMLTILAALITISASTVVWLVRQQSEIPVLVNIAGRQRMLSQRLVALSLWGRITQENASLTDAARRRQLDSLASEIDTVRKQLRINHSALNGSSSSDEVPSLPRTSLSAIHAIDGSLSVADRLSQEIANDLRGATDTPGPLTRLDALVSQRVALTTAMDSITFDLARRGQRQLWLIQTVAASCVVLILLVIVHMSRYVFRPAARAVESLVSAVEESNRQLASQADALQESADELEAQNTELIAQQDELERQAEEMARLTAISDASPDPIVAFHLNGEILYANRAARELTSMTRVATDARTAIHILDVSCQESMRTVAIPQALRDGIWRGETLLALDSGVRRPVQQTLVAHRWPDGTVAYISSVMQDMSAIKAVQAELAERETRYRTVVDSLAEGVVLQDEEGQIVAWNASAEQILGLSSDQLSGRTSYDANWEARTESGELMRGEDHPIVRARVEGVQVNQFVTQVRRGDGSRRWLSVNARPIESADASRSRSAVATFTDITDRRSSEEERRALAVAVEQSHHAVLITGVEMRITWANAAWEALTGYSLSEALGRTPQELLHGAHTSDDTFSALRARVDAGETWNGELLTYRRDGSPVWIELSVTPTRDASGKLSGTVAVSQDVTVRREAVRERERLATAVALTADGIAIVGVTGMFEFVNHAYARMHHLTRGNLLGSPWQRLYALDESERLASCISPAVASVGVWQGEATGWRSDSSQFPQALSVTQLPTGGLVFVVRDITERIEAEEKLRQQSLHDELTGLYNRRGFLTMAEHALRAAERNGMSCTLMFGDLDKFKTINDTFGHEVGDAALREVASLLRDTFRESDLVARLAGDEFTVLAMNATHADLEPAVSRLKHAIHRGNADRETQPGASQYVLGLTFGTATFDPSRPVGLDELLRVADEDLYARKRVRQVA